mgnify:CR=1 FL=1
MYFKVMCEKEDYDYLMAHIFETHVFIMISVEYCYVLVHDGLY